VEDNTKRLPASFYRAASGAEPVRVWLKGLQEADRHILGYDIGVVEFGWPQGMPLCRPLGRGLWEVRTTLTGNRIARVMFCVTNGSMILLHGFIKKTQKTPQSELELARKRQREVEQ
jgi:phage-related protein